MPIRPCSMPGRRCWRRSASHRSRPHPGLEPSCRRSHYPGCLPPFAADTRAGGFRHVPAAAHPVAATGSGILRPLPILLLADDGNRHARAGRPARRPHEIRSRLAPRPRPGGDRGAGHRRLDRVHYVDALSVGSGRYHRRLRLHERAAAMDGAGAGDHLAVEPVRRRQRRAQAPSWAAEFDHDWIDLPGLAALGVLASLAVAPLWLNPVHLAGLWPGRGTRHAMPRRPGSSPWSAPCWSWAWPSCWPRMLSSPSWSIAISSPSRCW